MNIENILQSIIKKTLRIPTEKKTDNLSNSTPGLKITMQLESALLKIGFKLSTDLFSYLAHEDPTSVKIQADAFIIPAIKELVGDHVKHNVYFQRFPNNIPDTEEFWAECITDALLNPKSAGNISLQLSCGYVNLYDLPKYGQYLHSYEEMIKCHEAFIPNLFDDVKILHRGGPLWDEAFYVYNLLAGSKVPINEDDRDLLKEICMIIDNPETLSEINIPIRENRAIVNAIMIENKSSLVADPDTVTDILRIACVLSDGDVTLLTPTKFKSFSNYNRRILLKELENVVASNLNKLDDVKRYAERWKRLDERLHSGRYIHLNNAKKVFEIARTKKHISLTSKIEEAFKKNDIKTAVILLKNKPGELFRKLDKIIRSDNIPSNQLTIAINNTIGDVSGRVLLSVYEHLINRLDVSSTIPRIFANKKGTCWVTPDIRHPIYTNQANDILATIDSNISSRLPKYNTTIIIDPNINDVALPISNKNTTSGFNTMPRGSMMKLSKEYIRFFMYWKQTHERTDYDLSTIVLDENLQMDSQISWTNLSSGNGCHSGDITNAPNGASEFIEIKLPNDSKTRYILPQINIYCGETFTEIEEAFFGYMERNEKQKGTPFEPRAVKIKSDIRGNGEIAIPITFFNKNSAWYAKWLNLFVNGYPFGNRVENNRYSTTLLTKAIIDKTYINVGTMAMFLKNAGNTIKIYDEKQTYIDPVVFIGLNIPDKLPEGSKTFTLTNLSELIPE